MDSAYFLSDLFSDVSMNALSVEPVVALVIAVFLLFASGFVSASEVAFFSLVPADIEQIKERNQLVDRLITSMLNQSERLLASILIANNFVNVAVVTLCAFGINTLVNFPPNSMVGFVTQTVVLTFLLLLFGEIMPKIYAQRNALKFARFEIGRAHV